MAKNKDKQPTVEEIKDKLILRKDYYQQLHDDQMEMDTFYELDYDAGVPSTYPQRMPPTPRKWVDVGVIHFTLDNPKSRVPLRGDSETARKQTELLETFYNFWLQKDILTIKKAAKKLLKRGELFLRVNMDDTFYGSSDKERLFHFPLSLSLPDPINCFASPVHDGLVPADIIEKFEITVAEAVAMCERNGWNWKPTGESKKVSWVTYYDDKYRCFLLDDVAVLPQGVQPNILGFCPYVHIDAGFGDESYDGRPECQYRSLLWPLKDMFIMEVRNLSQSDAILGRYAWPHRKIKGDSAVGIQQAVRQLYPDGKFPTDPEKFIYEILGQMETEIEKGEEPPAALFQQQMMMREYSTPPSVLSGYRPAGVYAAQHQEDLMLTAKSTYKDAFKNLEDALAVTMGMGARIYEQVYKSEIQLKNFASEKGKSYPVIKPDDIKGHYDCEVQLLAEPPEANEMRKGLGKAYWQGGAISQETMLQEYFDMSTKEAQDEMARILVETVMKQPGTLGWALRDALKRMGMDLAVEELMQTGDQGLKGSPPLQVGEGTTLPPGGRPGTQGGVAPVPTRQEQEMGANL